MSQENVENVRRGYEAFARGDLDAVLERLDSDVDWHPAIAPILGVETVRGKEAVRRFSSATCLRGSTNSAQNRSPSRTSATLS
jgi:ketosteroid isomerase-like protein